VQSSRAGLQDRERRAEGFTLIEVLVSMAILGIFLGAVLSLLVASTGLARGNAQRTMAANLLTSQIEAVRAMPTLSIPDGRQVTTTVASGTTYTITQDSSLISSDATTCSGLQTTFSYKLVSVRITWPGMGSIRPVRGDTLKALGVGSDGVNMNSGLLAVSVAGASGRPTSGVDVTLSPGGAILSTDENGCALFADLAPGTYTATMSTPGYAGTTNTQSVSLSDLTVVGGQVQRATVTYDLARTIQVETDAPSTAIIPAGLPLRIGDTYVPDTTLPSCSAQPGFAACSSGLPGQLSGLFPAVYQVKLGACAETSPSQASVDLTPATPPATPVTVPVGVVQVMVKAQGAPIDATVTATHAPASGCPGGETYILAVTGGTGSFVLPYGTWTLSTTDTAAPKTVTLDPDTSSVSASLVTTG